VNALPSRVETSAAQALSSSYPEASIARVFALGPTPAEQVDFCERRDWHPPRSRTNLSLLCTLLI
jgi:hypothetical protein